MKRKRQNTTRMKLFVICFVTLSLFAPAALTCAASGEGGSEGDKSMSEKGTPIKLIINGTEIPAFLNDSKPARALLARLPYTVNLQRYQHDYCGIMREPLPYDQAELHSGWKNGDIAFAVSGNYFAILYKDEEISQQFDGMVTMGALTCDPAVMGTLDEAIAVRIELK